MAYFKLPSGDTSDRPTTLVAGMTRFNTTLSRGEQYNGYNWVGLGDSYGSQTNPATSAKAIIDAGTSVGDGIYWFKPTGWTGDPFACWCDMTNFGGGWMIVSKWYQDAPYSLDELFNANARNATSTYLLNGSQLSSKSTHSRLSRAQMNALWNSSSFIARIKTENGSSGLGTYFQKKITNTTNFDFWNAHYNARLWSDDNTSGSMTHAPGTTFKIMRYETSGDILTNSYTDFSQPAGISGIGWWDHVQVSAPNLGNIYVSRHMGFYGDIYTGTQWVLTSNPSDSRYTSADSDEGKRTIVYLK